MPTLSTTTHLLTTNAIIRRCFYPALLARTTLLLLLSRQHLSNVVTSMSTTTLWLTKFLMVSSNPCYIFTCFIPQFIITTKIVTQALTLDGSTKEYPLCLYLHGSCTVSVSFRSKSDDKYLTITIKCSLLLTVSKHISLAI